jgi:hypothetical protein
LPAALNALNVRSVIEDQINREFIDIDNLISVSIKSREKPEPSTSGACFDLRRLQDRSQLLRTRGAGP